MIIVSFIEGFFSTMHMILHSYWDLTDKFYNSSGFDSLKTFAPELNPYELGLFNIGI